MSSPSPAGNPTKPVDYAQPINRMPTDIESQRMPSNSSETRQIAVNYTGGAPGSTAGSPDLTRVMEFKQALIGIAPHLATSRTDAILPTGVIIRKITANPERIENPDKALASLSALKIDYKDVLSPKSPWSNSLDAAIQALKQEKLRRELRDPNVDSVLVAVERLDRAIRNGDSGTIETVLKVIKRDGWFLNIPVLIAVLDRVKASEIYGEDKKVAALVNKLEERIPMRDRRLKQAAIALLEGCRSTSKQTRLERLTTVFGKLNPDKAVSDIERLGEFVEAINGSHTNETRLANAVLTFCTRVIEDRNVQVEAGDDKMRARGWGCRFDSSKARFAMWELMIAILISGAFSGVTWGGGKEFEAVSEIGFDYLVPDNDSKALAAMVNLLYVGLVHILALKVIQSRAQTLAGTEGLELAPRFAAIAGGQGLVKESLFVILPTIASFALANAGRALFNVSPRTDALLISPLATVAGGLLAGLVKNGILLTIEASPYRMWVARKKPEAWTGWGAALEKGWDAPNTSSYQRGSYIGKLATAIAMFGLKEVVGPSLRVLPDWAKYASNSAMTLAAFYALQHIGGHIWQSLEPAIGLTGPTKEEIEDAISDLDPDDAEFVRRYIAELNSAPADILLDYRTDVEEQASDRPRRSDPIKAADHLLGRLDLTDVQTSVLEAIRDSGASLAGISRDDAMDALDALASEGSSDDAGRVGLLKSRIGEIYDANEYGEDGRRRSGGDELPESKTEEASSHPVRTNLSIQEQTLLDLIAGRTQLKEGETIAAVVPNWEEVVRTRAFINAAQSESNEYDATYCKGYLLGLERSVREQDD